VSISWLTHSTVISNLTTQRNAIEMLQMRIRILLEYLNDTEAGIIPVDHDIERQISSLCNRLPVVNNKEFNGEFLKVRSFRRGVFTCTAS
jgi:COP9 signalosome complex subunit 6